MKIRKKCDTCVHWKQEEVIFALFSKSTCTKHGRGGEGAPAPIGERKAGAFQIGGSDTYFLTAPEFGCVDHALRPAAAVVKSTQEAPEICGLNPDLVIVDDIVNLQPVDVVAIEAGAAAPKTLQAEPDVTAGKDTPDLGPRSWGGAV